MYQSNVCTSTQAKASMKIENHENISTFHDTSKYELELQNLTICYRLHQDFKLAFIPWQKFT